MLRQVFFITFVLITSFSYSQNKNVLDGIFKLRLGMSENEIREVVDASYISSDGSIFDIESQRDIVLDKYEPAKELIIEKIELSFFNDKLHMIKIGEYNYHIEKLLTEKYGKPKKKLEKNTKAIPYAERTSNHTYNHYRIVSEIITYTWKTGDKNIICTSDYESHIKNNTSSYTLLIRDKTAFESSWDVILQRK